MKTRVAAHVAALAWTLVPCSFGCERQPPEVVDERVVLESEGWQLAGDWLAPAGSDVELANVLSRHGVASLRLDLRGHGESDNLGRFEEPYAEHRSLLQGAHEDINIALRWLAGNPPVDPDRLAVVGASYSGEAIGEAIRDGGDAVSAYVLLSPGSFSDASSRTSNPIWSRERGACSDHFGLTS